MNRTDLQELAEIRIQEAQDLLALSIPRPDGAYYLAGYAVECALKAAISKLNSQHDFPDRKFVTECHTHDLAALMRLAQLEPALRSATAANQNLASNWSVVKDWNERGRYERHAQIKATIMVTAVIDAQDGVLPWIKAHW